MEIVDCGVRMGKAVNVGMLVDKHMAAYSLGPGTSSPWRSSKASELEAIAHTVCHREDASGGSQLLGIDKLAAYIADVVLTLANYSPWGRRSSRGELCGIACIRAASAARNRASPSER